MPADDLMALLQRLQGEAIEVLAESRAEAQSIAEEAETNRRLQLGYRTCEAVLADLDPPRGGLLLRAATPDRRRGDVVHGSLNVSCLLVAETRRGCVLAPRAADHRESWVLSVMGPDSATPRAACTSMRLA